MFLKKIISEQLAHNSYFLSSQGEAAIIDPRRDYHAYLDLAYEKDVRIKYIFETHRNEDYLIGSLPLSAVTGASIFHGNALDFNYGSPVKENDNFKVGSLELRVLETPGHTDESISITVKDTAISPKELLVFSGDTLFSGDTGRIDLYGENEKERLAENLFQSIHNKIIPLGDDVVLLPAHGKGSVCGKKIGDLDVTTIGYEKKTNRQLLKDKLEFISLKKEEEHLIPPYFEQMERVNKQGLQNNRELPFLSSISLDQFKDFILQDYQLLDIRYPSSFGSAHIPNSINIWIDGLSSFAGWFLDYNKPILLIDSNNNIKKALKLLYRLGYDNIYGYLKNGFTNWYTHNEKTNNFTFWSPSKLHEHIEDDTVYILDVRDKTSRDDDGFIKNSHHVFVGVLENNISSIPKDKTIVVYCDSGFKTSIACSILLRNNFHSVINLLGGISAWTEAYLPLEKEKQSIKNW